MADASVLVTECLEWLRQQRIDLQHHQSDCLAICSYLTNRAPMDVFVELGVYQGGSAFILSHFVRGGGTVIGVDPVDSWSLSYDTTRGAAASKVAAEIAARGKQVQFIKKFSSAALGNVKRALGRRKIDLLHIDGDHSLVQQDFEMYAPLVAKAGTVLLHDICNGQTPVPAYWAQLCGKYKRRAIPLWFSDKRKYSSGVVAF